MGKRSYLLRFRIFILPGVISIILATIFTVAYFYFKPVALQSSTMATNPHPYWDFVVLVVPIVAAISGIVLASYIALNQQDQVLELTDISTHTNEISQAIYYENFYRENVNDFFRIDERPSPEFNCYFPAEPSDGRPLPTIHSGDFYALQILYRALGSALALKPLQRGRDGHQESKRDLANDEDGVKSSIFICSPKANARLAKEYPIWHEDSSMPSAGKSADFPVWFLSLDKADGVEGSDNDRTSMRLAFNEREHVAPLMSPVDALYNTDENYFSIVEKEGDFIHNDYGIIARIRNSRGGNDFIIAGIHQHGTWICARYLESTLRANPMTEEFRAKSGPIFYQKHDFVALVEGPFKLNTLQVVDKRTQIRDAWQRIESVGWVRFYPGTNPDDVAKR